MSNYDNNNDQSAETSGKSSNNTSLAALPAAMALNLQALGKLLRERRQAAKLTQAKLAKLAGLTEVTVRNIEYAHNPPSEDTLRRLLEVPQLNLRISDLPTVHLYDLQNDLDFYRNLHWFIAPDYEILKLWMDFRKQLNSDAGQIDQTYLYLDAESATDYVQMSSHYDAIFRQNAPLPELAQVVIQNLQKPNMDIIALGPGTGSLETRLAVNLLTLQPEIRLRFHLLDISQPLLNVAYRHATDMLSSYQHVFVAGMLGNFYDLPSYQHILYVPPNRPTCRMFVIIGSTLSNIDNEIRFVRNTLGIATTGDLLAITVQRSPVPEVDETSIHNRDETVKNPFPKHHAKWLGGPIRRYCENVVDVDFKWAIRLDCVVPDSYAIDAIAQVGMKDRHPRQISMYRFKRYNVKKLSDCLAAEGWEPLFAKGCELRDERSEYFMLFRKVPLKSA